jgi:hypothetical protein
MVHMHNSAKQESATISIDPSLLNALNLSQSAVCCSINTCERRPVVHPTRFSTLKNTLFPNTCPTTRTGHAYAPYDRNATSPWVVKASMGSSRSSGS